MSHKPVMLEDVLGALAPCDGGVYVDGTFGAGGYSRAILERADCIVVAIDRDPDAEKRALALAEEYNGRFFFIRGCFGDVARLLAEAGFKAVDGFVLDLGVSSFQLDEAERGFSFRFDGKLDMRMDAQASIPDAADIVNTLPEKDLAAIIYKYGEERHSRRVARHIARRRADKPFESTLDLAEAVRAAVPPSRKDRIDPATRTFQALRIAVNDELGELERALEGALAILKPGGRLVVVSFHSLEDGLVKNFMRCHAGQAAKGSRHLPEAGKIEPLFDLPSKKPVFPADAEVRANPRARSARLRQAVRTDAPYAGGRP